MDLTCAGLLGVLAEQMFTLWTTAAGKDMSSLQLLPRYRTRTILSNARHAHGLSTSRECSRAVQPTEYIKMIVLIIVWLGKETRLFSAIRHKREAITNALVLEYIY